MRNLFIPLQDQTNESICPFVDHPCQRSAESRSDIFRCPQNLSGNTFLDHGAERFPKDITIPQPVGIFLVQISKQILGLLFSTNHRTDLCVHIHPHHVDGRRVSFQFHSVGVALAYDFGFFQCSILDIWHYDSIAGGLHRS